MADNAAGSVLVNIFTSPSAAFAAIKEIPRPLLPLLILMIGTFAAQFAYMQAVDFPWLMDRQLQAGPGAAQMTEEQRSQTVDALTQIPPTVLGAAQGGGGALVILIVYSLIALYYTGVSFATRDGVKFKQWLALIAWCSLPGVFGMIASLVNLQVTDARFLPAEQLNPLSFGSLLALDAEGATIVQRILLTLDVTVLWATVLQILGYQYFTQKSIVTATIVVLGPLALIVGISALAALF
jgi:Yip1 domain